MAFTAKLGSSDSQLANIELGLGAVIHPDGTGTVTAPHPTLSGTGLKENDIVVQFVVAGTVTTCTAHNTLVIATSRIDNGTRIGSVTDTQGNTWTRTGGPYAASGNVCEQWAAFNVVGGSITITINYAVGGSANIYNYELALENGGKAGGSGTGTATNDSQTTSTVSTVARRAVEIVSAQHDQSAFIVAYNFPNAQHSSAAIADSVSFSRMKYGPFTFNGAWNVTNTRSAMTATDLMVVYEDGTAGPGQISAPKPQLSGTGNAEIHGTGSVTAPAPTLKGQVGETGSGSIIAPAPTLSGAGIWTNPLILNTQLPVEDGEIADTQNAVLTQIVVEDVEIPSFELTSAQITQMVVEILIPFDCDLTPPLTLPPGCPPDEIEGDGSNSAGCSDSPAPGSGTSKAGCKPTFRN